MVVNNRLLLNAAPSWSELCFVAAAAVLLAALRWSEVSFVAVAALLAAASLSAMPRARRDVVWDS